jgi:hypothetical protein
MRERERKRGRKKERKKERQILMSFKETIQKRIITEKNKEKA